MAALLCVTAGGGFDGLPLGRGWLQTLTVLSTLALAIVSVARFETVPHSGPASRRVIRSFIHVFPLLTMLLVMVSLNPRLAPGLPQNAVGLPWVVCAAASLTLCGGYLGYRLVAAVGNRIRGIDRSFLRGNELHRKNLARIPDLDPERDFSELVHLAAASGTLGEAALTRLRRNPDFISRLVDELTEATPSSGALDHALAVVAIASLTPGEQGLLAVPCRTAMERITRYLRSESRHLYRDKGRRTAVLRRGNRLFQSIATKLAGTGVKFQSALDGFNMTFTTPDSHNR